MNPYLQQWPLKQLMGYAGGEQQNRCLLASLYSFPWHFFWPRKLVEWDTAGEGKISSYSAQDQQERAPASFAQEPEDASVFDLHRDFDKRE